MKVMVEFPLDEAQAVTGRLMDRDLEEAALRRIERALKVEQGSQGAAQSTEAKS